jgi:hypothetical protein
MRIALVPRQFGAVKGRTYQRRLLSIMGSRSKFLLPGDPSGVGYLYVVVITAATLLYLVLTEYFRQSNHSFWQAVEGTQKFIGGHP